jgi:hypothetical protein
MSEREYWLHIPITHGEVLKALAEAQLPATRQNIKRYVHDAEWELVGAYHMCTERHDRIKRPTTYPDQPRKEATQ